VSNSLFADGNADGIQAGTGLNIINNEFRNIKENGPNDQAHTDAIQLIDAPYSLVQGNYIHNTADGIVAYDGLSHATIQDNVIDLINGRWGIELYSDNGSIVRHNTLVYNTGCAYAACGYIILDRKSADPAGTATVVSDNIATDVSISNGSTAAQNTHNMLRTAAGSANTIGTPVYSGGSAPGAYSGFTLASSSPGNSAATDGADVGRR
jgi:hypothetical protein